MAKYISKLAGKRVLVFGGTSGLGFCVAEAAVEYGATVIVSGSSQAKLDKAIERLRPSLQASVASPVDEASRILGKTCDLGNLADLEANLKALLDYATSAGRDKLDHVVFSAGDSLNLTPVSQATPELVTAVFAIRYTAPLILAKLLPAYMDSQPANSLTLTSGVAGVMPPPGWAVMASVCSAVEGLARGLAVDLKPIRVNVVRPGAVHTELFGQFGDQLPMYVEMFKSNSLTGTVGKPEDLADAYLHFMKDSFITGTVTASDGGRSLI